MEIVDNWQSTGIMLSEQMLVQETAYAGTFYPYGCLIVGEIGGNLEMEPDGMGQDLERKRRSCTGARAMHLE